MLLIADSGSTKTSWCLLNEKKETLFFETEGYNPYHVHSNYISDSVAASFTDAALNKKVQKICFYGSGCFPETAPVISTALLKVFPAAAITVELDLLAAARALLQSSAGFAAILGTGTNSCLYDGKSITHNIDSLGYILGDEGSGTALGKKLLGDYIRGYMPGDIHQLFYKLCPLSKNDIFQKIYQEPMANRFCSSFALFIHEHIQHPYLSDLTKNCFRSFFRNIVSAYPGYQQYTFNSIGSVAYNFSSHLKQTALEFGMQTGIIAQSPMEGLLHFHNTYDKDS